MLRTVRPFIPFFFFFPFCFPNNEPGTQWPPTGGSLVINGSHAHAFTYVNLALGSNATNFNITLLDVFNQTGAGIFCTKETGKSYLDAAFKAAGYSGSGDARLDGTLATVQVIQLGGRGSALYNVSFYTCLVLSFGGKKDEDERNEANVCVFFFSVRISCLTQVLRCSEMTSVRMERVLVVLRLRMRVRRLQSLGIRRPRRRSLMLRRGSWLVDWEVRLLRRWSRGCWSNNSRGIARLGWGSGRMGVVGWITML